jgi:hypothetical protein
MVSGDYDGSLAGGNTYDAWVNGSSRKTSALTGVGYVWNMPFGAPNGVIGWGFDDAYAQLPIRHYGSVWLSRGEVLDPVTHWSSFFNPDNTMKDLGSGVIGGITPTYYYSQTRLLTGVNGGNGPATTLFGSPEAVF